MEVENLCRYLASRDINITSSNKWLNECVRWFKSNPNLMVTYGSLQDYVSVQWLLSDLKDVRNSCLPIVNDDRTTVLPGKYAVQINWMRDIGQSCYSQYRSIQSKDSISNDEVTAEESKKQNWEPNPKRVLMMEITDGVKTMKAMEFGAIPKLGTGFLPGMKMLLKGPIECRRKILFLKNSNVDIFGGEVDSLYEANRVENVLSRCLNLPPLRPTPTSVEDSNSTVTTTQNQNTTTSTRTYNSNLQNSSSLTSGPNARFQTNGSLRGTIQSTGSVLNNTHFRAPASNGLRNPAGSEFNIMQSNGNGGMNILDEDDDDLFDQVPDDLLEGKECEDRRRSSITNNFNDFSSKPSSTPQPGPSFAFQVPYNDSSSSTHRSLQINKHKRFPSMDDFTTEENLDASINRPLKKQSTLSNFVLQKTSASISSKGVANSSKYFSPSTPSLQSPIVLSDSSRTSSFNSPNSNSPVVHPFNPTSTSTCLKNVERKSSVSEIDINRQPWDDSQATFDSNFTSNVPLRNGSDYIHVQDSRLEDDKEDESIAIVGLPEQTYPIVKKLRCKISETPKIRVKEHKWTCEATAIIEGKSTKVQFSNELVEFCAACRIKITSAIGKKFCKFAKKVLVEIFGVTASYIEDLRHDKNPSIRPKLNDILTKGQKKVKELNSLVTIEYFDDDSLPKITVIHDR